MLRTLSFLLLDNKCVKLWFVYVEFIMPIHAGSAQIRPLPEGAEMTGPAPDRCGACQPTRKFPLSLLGGGSVGPGVGAHDRLGALRCLARRPIAKRIAELVMPTLIAVLSRAVIGIRMGGCQREGESCDRCGGEGDVAHFHFSLVWMNGLDRGDQAPPSHSSLR